MKVLIIGFSERSLIPYVERYEEILREENISFEIIFWDRLQTAKPTINDNEFHFHQKVGFSKWLKPYALMKYRTYVLKLIKIKKYTHIVVLTTIPGILLFRKLVTQYKNKYILDIRDYSYEKFSFYKKAVNKLVNNSCFTAISSTGFLKFLEKNSKIIPIHNITNAKESICFPQPYQEKDFFCIGFLGNIRYFKENVAFIESFKNTKDFKLFYAGQVNEKKCNLPQYCQTKNIKNVEFYGSFSNSDKPALYQKIDLINSIYGNFSLEVTTALPNRLYDALLFKKPIIASKGTYLGTVVEEYGLGIVVDVYAEDVCSKVREYMFQFNSNQFFNNCNLFLDIVQGDMKKFKESFQEFLNQNC